MKYTKKACEKADEILAKRRQQDNDEYEKRLFEIQQNAPEIANMNRQIKEVNFELVKLIGSGKRDEGVKEKINQIREKNLSLQQAVKNMLREFGYPEDYLQMQYHCPKCRDYGSAEGVRCECLTKLLEKYTSEELNAQCSIKLHNFSEFREDFYPVTVIEGKSVRERMHLVYINCKKYAENFNEHSPSLFFYGKTGLGKTFLSSCIASFLLDEGVNVVFGSILDILRKINDEYFKKAEGNTAEIVKEAELLILDDLGSEFINSFSESALYEILNYRLNLEKPTIISTNLSMQELGQKYNERIVSRLTGSFLPYAFLGSDIRPAIRDVNVRNLRKNN